MFVPNQPHTYPRRILLTACGLTPQIITETVYALAVARSPAFVPTEIHVLTTAEGAEQVRLCLLSEDPGWFSRLCRDYSLERIRFTEDNIHLLKDDSGNDLSDIRTETDNECAADIITELVRALTADPDSALHVSIAGGRKTMGFYLGYALSLFGRPQDRLSHVLVSAPFESNREFYYPTRQRRVIYTSPPEVRPLDASTATVTLAEIPFVRLRHGLPQELLKGKARFLDVVRAAQLALGPPHLELDLPGRRIRAGGVEIRLPPAELAFLSWFARRRLGGLEGLQCPKDEPKEPSYAREFLREYRGILGKLGPTDRAEHALRNGMDKSYFLERRSRLHKLLRKRLGHQAEPYFIHAGGRRPYTTYELRLPPEQICYIETKN